MASISSMKTIAGAALRACSNRSRTRAAPTPTNISTNSEPLVSKKATLASPALALASSVLPVPGGPTSNTPFGICPPSSANCSGSFRNWMISCSSAIASSAPPTSLYVTLTSSGLTSMALFLPTPKMLPSPRSPIRHVPETAEQCERENICRQDPTDGVWRALKTVRDAGILQIFDQFGVACGNKYAVERDSCGRSICLRVFHHTFNASIPDGHFHDLTVCQFLLEIAVGDFRLPVHKRSQD